MPNPQFTRAQVLALTAAGLITASSNPAQGAETPATDFPVIGGIRELWITDPSRFGQPLAAEEALGAYSVYQTFSKGVIIWNDRAGSSFFPGEPGTYLRTGPGNKLRKNQFLGPQDALIIGDSQVGEPDIAPSFWVGRGFTQAGYIPHYYSWGGIGVNPYFPGHPSYFDSIVNNATPMPLGDPGIVYLGGAGADLTYGVQISDISGGMRMLTRALKVLYPNSQIILSEIIGRREPHHAERHALSEELAQVAKDEGVFILPNRYWFTDKNLIHLMQDDVHLNPEGHIALAPHLTNWLRWATGKGFADITPENSIFHQEIAWMRTAGIATGWEDGTYRPDQPIARDAMAAFFYRFTGAYQSYYSPPKLPFTDVPFYHPFYHAIAWMYESEITTGWPDGTYRPDQPVTRDAMAAFFYRLAGKPDFTPPAQSPFHDVPTDRAFYKEIAWLRQTGISTGWPDGTYRPDQPIARDAMAAFLYRYKDL